MRTLAQHVQSSLSSFAGLPGVSWLTSVLLAPGRRVVEHLAPRDIADEDTRFLEIDGRLVAYHEHGAGAQTVILLHGFGSRWQTWRAVQHALAGHCRTVSIDLWGFGASDRPATLTPRQWTRQVLGTMDALGIDTAHMVGHSLGGRVTLMCAAQAPHRFPAIGLLACDWGQAPHGYRLLQGLASCSVVRRLLGRLRGNPAHIRRLMQLAYAPEHPITPQLLESHCAPLLVQGTAAAYEHVCAAPRHEIDLSNDLPRVQCPALILWGERDRIIPRLWAKPLASRLPDARLSILPGVGHLPQDERPDLVAEYLQAFFNNLPSPVEKS